MNTQQEKYHKHFRLNGVSFSSISELLLYSKTISVSIFTFLTNWFDAQDHIIVETSGSTGSPKKIELKKEYMVNSAKATGRLFNLKENTTALLCLSADYIAGKMMLVRALTLGWQLEVTSPVSKVTIQKEYDFSAMVPMQLQSSLAQINNIKILIVGGGVVHNNLLQKIQHLKTQIFATYGMTETITHIAVKKINNFSAKRNIETTYYKVVPNVKIFIDQRNCLTIQAPKITDGLIITNDMVQLISDNQFEWLGRYDNVINSGGIKLHPEKIEKKLSKLLKQRFFVAGVADEVLGEKLILVIEGKEQKDVLRTQSLLSKYEIPKNIYFVNTFAETPTKKIQRKKTLEKVFKK